MSHFIQREFTALPLPPHTNHIKSGSSWHVGAATRPGHRLQVRTPPGLRTHNQGVLDSDQKSSFSLVKQKLSHLGMLCWYLFSLPKSFKAERRALRKRCRVIPPALLCAQPCLCPWSCFSVQPRLLPQLPGPCLRNVQICTRTQKPISERTWEASMLHLHSSRDVLIHQSTQKL